jgi:hypothetical protein
MAVIRRSGIPMRAIDFGLRNRLALRRIAACFDPDFGQEN